ncbi:MAG: helix-turn-helix domain-containing protein [Ruminococcus sp.]|uniref:helix-turn-helix domain-containing protein n=1 Tax=Ruminococcus sp. TaxID=41978 RepID=UPI0025D2D62D|nr:helix-turn-helix domain-containing protein [Ruminococcus sp.]MBO4867969.1 helix-turn-helix domain-containing protein [Ruminococcus sp.]
MSDDVKDVPFIGEWRFLRRVESRMYTLYSTHTSGKTVTLYIHSFKPKRIPDFALNDNSTVSDRLKFYRISCGLMQKEIAAQIGVVRTTYARWENNVLSAYPLDKLTLLAEIFGCKVTDLLDEYNKFLIKGQGSYIRNLQKKKSLTRCRLAELMSVSVGRVKDWESERKRVSMK